MVVLVCYDIQTMERAGQRRLRRVAKACLSYGQRVQFSVFECKVTPALWAQLKAKLLSLYDPGEDSLRFYFLGEDDVRQAEHHGVKPSLDFEAPLVL
ncbi:MAG: CRISPR-associated protein Cas2 [Holophagaceae bacterium]|uniref:CRISPR-associated endonuclease Cas2 n=1 Tax=Holophaga foetida TaxID=35839 RepID=UPI000247460C|nr:CRISPR-associated endonuclease Cas2 [Holophaga foetida]MBP1627898.1 CRISPR-associated protein Cas2 [Holophagaceae bacterium]